MKRQILSGLASLAVASVALGRTDPAYINNSVLIFPPGVPPMIDATNFINNVAFIDNTYNSLFISPYATANTVNYTNYGVLSAVQGFRFDTFNTHVATPFYASAGNFYNAGGAIINCGGTNNGAYSSGNTIFFSLSSETECLVWATNVINRGTIEMGPDSLLSLRGRNISLSGGLLNMEGFETGYSYGAGWFDGYWGLGQTPEYNPASYFGFQESPLHWTTNRNYSARQRQLYLPRSNAYLNPLVNHGPSNFVYQVVFLQNTNASISNNVYFSGDSVVEWVWSSTNIVTGVAQNNHLFLHDSLNSDANLVLVTNGVAPPNTAYGWTYIPTNYSFFTAQSSFFGIPATPGLPIGVIGPNTNMTTGYAAYQALFQPTTAIVSDVAGQSYNNMVGRIEVTADKQLDLSGSRIAALNYLRLTATNNFTRDANTRVLTPVADYNLGVTNSTLTVSNLLAPTCPRLNGLVNLFSTAWTNITASGITNTYFITMVDSQLASSAPSVVLNLTLRATNVVISDVLNVLSNITIDAYNVTITTNGPGAQARAGQLNFPPGQAPGPGAFPRLQTLTNSGVISASNTAYFGSAATPLWYFVNRGSVLAQGISIWATNFVNTGLLNAGPGPINLAATSAVISNGVFYAPYNDINLGFGSLFISHLVLNAGHGLTIQAANSLTDGGSASGNFWTVGVLGFNLPSKPPIASLLGTTITNTAPPYTSVSCQWAGNDLGPVAVGYSNNAALGRLILDGGSPGSSFVFNAPTGTNALYVDYLEFRNCLTNFDGSGNLANLSFGPGMKIYYAQLIINGISYAEKLNHKNDGGLNWVSGYAGAFSSTNLVYPDGTTHQLNLALVQSCNLDSNGNGIANCVDPAPIFVSSQMNFTAAFTNAPRRAVVLSWDSIPYATNFVFFRTNLTAANWLLLTNPSFVTNPFVLGSVGGRQRVLDYPTNAGSRFYRVRVDAAAP